VAVSFPPIPSRLDPTTQAFLQFVQTQISALDSKVFGDNAPTDTASITPAASWQLYDLSPTDDATGTIAGSGGFQTLTPTGVPSEATHAYIYFEALTGTANDQITIQYRADSGSSTYTAIVTPAVQGNADSNNASNTVAVPLTAGSYQYSVSGTFSGDTSWRLTTIGYFM